MVKNWLLLLVVFPSILLLSACSLLPATATGPTCGWTTTIPSNGQAMCQESYRIFVQLARAELDNDRKAIRSLVQNRSVALRILRYGRYLRSENLRYLHPATTFLMTSQGRNQALASGDLKGQTTKGHLDLEEVLRIRFGRHPEVTGDQRYQEW